ncbi:MAG: glycosyltransferase family 9 protein [Candidatus Omnitrophica bacterium]|nr:glycosyltransferase family 9 protein [Candidatus Omnitrophota bacterium]
MFAKLSNNSNIKSILLISLSNIGDVILTFPVLDRVKATFPDAEISVLVGVKGKSLFDGNPHIRRTITYDKQMPIGLKWKWFLELRREHFDLVVDLRNSMLPFLLNAKYMTFPALGPSREHMREKHLKRLYSVLPEPLVPLKHYALIPPEHAARDIKANVHGLKDYILIAPGAADQKKRWTAAGFAALIRHFLHEGGRQVVIVGDQKDRLFAEEILKGLPGGIINISGLTTLLELAGVIERAALCVTNDSGIMHMASYLDRPIVALFGPTDPELYGPWSTTSRVVQSATKVMGDIAVENVVMAVREVARA